MQTYFVVIGALRVKYLSYSRACSMHENWKDCNSESPVAETVSFTEI